jgi:hypothetical protein
LERLPLASLPLPFRTSLLRKVRNRILSAAPSRIPSARHHLETPLEPRLVRRPSLGPQLSRHRRAVNRRQPLRTILLRSHLQSPKSTIPSVPRPLAPRAAEPRRLLVLERHRQGRRASQLPPGLWTRTR